MKSLTFFNNKGGVGKTTLLCNFAAICSIDLNLKVLVVDADPQCNATQYMFDDEKLHYFYEETSSFTIHNVIRPLSLGKGYSKELSISSSDRFQVDVLPGDPRLALTEDLLARDWSSASGGDARGIRTTLLFSELLERCGNYDIVIFDVGPSLGSINRAVLLATDFFVAPMSIDIFSVKAIENIAAWISRWSGQWENGLQSTEDQEEIEFQRRKLSFLGYVSQQYIAKKDATGTKRAVSAYDRIMGQFDSIIRDKLLVDALEEKKSDNYDLGSIPNLHSLIPMSQSSRAPVFELKASDGVRGAHFTKVKDSRVNFFNISSKILTEAGVPHMNHSAHD